MKTFKRVIFLLADGARDDVMSALLEEGHLPNIKKYLEDAGTKNIAVTAFPSTTGPAYMPFLTGCLPATCNVPGIRWLDKVKYATSKWSLGKHRSYVGLEAYLTGFDMRRKVSTLFDLFPNSFNIFNSVNKGVSFRGNMTSISRIWYWYYGHLTNHWNFVDNAALCKLKKAITKNFEMIFVVMPGIDEYSHIAHYRHPEAVESYKKVDNAVKLISEILYEKKEYEDSLLIWLISDHGLSVTHTHFCVNKFLEDKDIRTLYYPKIFKKKCVAANMMSGNSMAHLYFKHDHGWQYPVYNKYLEKKYPGLLDELLQHDAVDVLACRFDPNTVEVRTKRGKAFIQIEGDSLRYIISGSDPFGYENISNSITSDEILSLTVNSDYPDAPYQLAHIFTSVRTGDVVLSAAKGYDLRNEYEVPEHKGSHGSLHRDHMIVPILCNAKLQKKNIRTVDVFPTTLNLLGHPVPGMIDGKDLSC